MISVVRRGFLLFEVMISLVIISVGLISVCMAFSSVKKAFKLSNEMINASVALEGVLWEYHDKGGIPLDEDRSIQDMTVMRNTYNGNVSAENIEDTDMNIVSYSVWEPGSEDRDRYKIQTLMKNVPR